MLFLVNTSAGKDAEIVASRASLVTSDIRHAHGARAAVALEDAYVGMYGLAMECPLLTGGYCASEDN